jgi:hypothetical protein
MVSGRCHGRPVPKLTVGLGKLLVGEELERVRPAACRSHHRPLPQDGRHSARLWVSGKFAIDGELRKGKRGTWKGNPRPINPGPHRQPGADSCVEVTAGPRALRRCPSRDIYRVPLRSSNSLMNFGLIDGIP